MLTELGVPALHWLRAKVRDFDNYLERWEAFLLDLPYRDWPASATKETR